MRWIRVRRGQQQSGGDDSNNYQAGRDIVQCGVSASEARTIALDVYNANFLTLSGVAEQVARDRAERITQDFLEKLQERDPGGLASMQDPDMLRTVFTAQEGFACSGEEDLAKALVDILVDRAAQKERDLKTLVLNEAISVLPKLTAGQRNGVTACFLIRYTRYVGEFDLDSFYAYIEQWGSVLDIESTRRADYQHVQSAGAGLLTTFSSFDVEDAFAEAARGFFTEGFTSEQVPDDLREFLDDPEIFMPCLRDGDKIQVNGRSVAEISELEIKKGLPTQALLNLSRLGMMTHEEIRKDLVARVVGLGPFLDHWKSSGLSNFELTTAGIAIGHAYYRHVTGVSNAPLDSWLYTD